MRIPVVSVSGNNLFNSYKVILISLDRNKNAEKAQHIVKTRIISRFIKFTRNPGADAPYPSDSRALTRVIYWSNVMEVNL